ncbi:hypothetical protein C8Q73DRAFT_795240 [Cubamyces lactineus]|nr:hypothetical protein C8Q73DRAFT_795240 [Cubamyces lactineus]
MPLSPDLAAAFQYIADQVSNLNEVQYFDRTIQTHTKEFVYDGRKFAFVKLGYSQLGTAFAGIGYKVKWLTSDGLGSEREWTIWIINPVDAVTVNRRAVIGAFLRTRKTSAPGYVKDIAVDMKLNVKNGPCFIT